MKQQQRGSVLVEAMVIFGVLVGLLTATHLSGRWQYQWLGHQLDTQTQATALALGHTRQPTSDRTAQSHLSHLSAANRQSGQTPDPTRTLAEREFGLDGANWLHLQRQTRFKQHAWRLVGTGHASTDADTTQRLSQAKQLWMQTHLNSQRVVARLRPSLEAIEAALRQRGSMTDWTQTWQGSSPDEYLQGVNRFGSKPGLIGRFIEEALPW